MKKTIKLFAVTWACLMSIAVTAQIENTNGKKKNWGIETDLVAPFLPEVGIVTIKATRTITGNQGRSVHGDLLLGLYLRPNVEHDIVEKINEYLLTVGYRQYFYKGLHAEAQLLGGYAWGTRNKIDGKDYNNPAVLVESNIGYTINLRSKKDYNFYILPQAGVLAGVSTDIGPRGGKSDVFPQGKLIIGIRF